jgi:hypothetical protein
MAKKKFSGETIALVPRYVFVAVLLVTLVLLAITSYVTKDHGGAHRAWEVLIGVRTPVGPTIGLELPLSILGYAFVPAVIGLFVTDAVLRFTRKHTLPTADALDKIAEKAAASKKAAEAAAAQVRAAADAQDPPPPPGQPAGA